MSKQGSSQVSVFLTGVSEEQVSELMDDFADVLIRRKLTSDEDTCALLAVRGFDWPPEPEAFVDFVNREGYASVVIPAEKAA